MKIKTGQTIYYCDHCRKKMLRKKAMENHEKWCANNPENRRACEYCKHLETITIDISYDDPYSIGTRKTNAFRCKVFDKLIYPVKVERKGLSEKYPETFENQEPMPRICEHQNISDHFPFD